ncbi:MAG TPA: type 1 glutamine amidotransferase domain-containing protein [Rhodoblastus sp.]|nr:type 1 glutamine amidotransferase domain-containing protein [Rhodoblastus sp.]
MARVLIPLPVRDYDPTEAAVSWRVLRDLGHTIVFATPDGAPAEADDLMLHGRGLDPWGIVPGLDRLVLVGRFMRADDAGRAAYDAMTKSPEWRSPLRWTDARETDFDGLLLPGGHRARGMRAYLESAVLQALAIDFFRADKPVGSVCHGVVLLARSVDPATGRSVLHGRKTTALTWALEGRAVQVGRIARWWDPTYYSTYPDQPGEPAGHRGVQAEVTRALADPGDFCDVPPDMPDAVLKTSGRARDRRDDARPAFVVEDGNYVSARWPGDVHTFAAAFARRLPAAAR